MRYQYVQHMVKQLVKQSQSRTKSQPSKVQLPPVVEIWFPKHLQPQFVGRGSEKQQRYCWIHWRSVRIDGNPVVTWWGERVLPRSQPRRGSPKQASWLQKWWLLWRSTVRWSRDKTLGWKPRPELLEQHELIWTSLAQRRYQYSFQRKPSSLLPESANRWDSICYKRRRCARHKVESHTPKYKCHWEACSICKATLGNCFENGNRWNYLQILDSTGRLDLPHTWWFRCSKRWPHPCRFQSSERKQVLQLSSATVTKSCFPLHPATAFGPQRFGIEDSWSVPLFVSHSPHSLLPWPWFFFFWWVSWKLAATLGRLACPNAVRMAEDGRWCWSCLIHSLSW